MTKIDQLGNVRRGRSPLADDGHYVPSPFPVSTKLGVVIDEVCRCGKLRSEHEDSIAYGHGPCVVSSCPKFSWARMLYIREGKARA